MAKKPNPQKKHHSTVAHALNVARRAVIRHARNKPRTAGSFTCPVCQNGTRRFSISGARKIHSVCTTPGCPSLMD